MLISVFSPMNWRWLKRIFEQNSGDNCSLYDGTKSIMEPFG
jgi:hypothetical protein